MITQFSRTVRHRIDNGPMSALQIGVVFLCFLLNFVDGFDVVAMSVAAPSLSADWAVGPTEKGYILSAALVGMTLGAVFLAPYADVIGRRNILVLAMILISFSMIATGLIPQSVTLMICVRIITGLGIGIVFANSAAIASEFATEKLRNISVTTVIMGYPFGAMAVGPFANFVIPLQGWQMLFIYGGVFALIVTVVVWFFLPESIEFLAGRRSTSGAALDRINETLLRMGRTPISSVPGGGDVETVQASTVRSLFEDGLMRLNNWSLVNLFSWVSRRLLPLVMDTDAFCRQRLHAR